MASSCYFGFVKQLHESLQKEGFEYNQDDSSFDSFINEFVMKESNKENSIFTDIDNENQDIEYKVEFDFSIEQIQQKFANFLGLEEAVLQQMQQGNDEEIEEEEQEIEQDEEAEEEQKQENEEKQENAINSQELREEL